MQILVVSPFAADRSALDQLLADDGHEVTAVATREEGLALASAASPDALIADAQVVGLDGRELVRALSERGLRPLVILLCSRAHAPGCESERMICLTKPIALSELRRYLGRECTPGGRAE